MSSKSKRNTPTKEMLREVARTAPPAISAAEAADALQRHMGATGAVVASAARARRIGRPAQRLESVPTILTRQEA